MPEYVLTIIRSVIAFILLLIMARIMGKKQISQLTFFDYCVGITIGSIAASLAVDQGIKITNGLIALLIWGIIPLVLGVLGLKSKWFHQLTDGKADVVIENGQILEKNLRKNQLAIEELMILLREKNVYNIEEVEMAIFETNGQISVLKKSEVQPVTPKLLGTPVKRDHGPTIIISDGHIMENSISKLGISKEWILAEIEKQGASKLEDVFLAQVDSMGNVYVDLYEDNLKRNTLKQKPNVAASLKKIKEEFETIAIQSEDQKVKELYTREAEKLQLMIENISPNINK
ncbi:DUF421 domain-containing protein [Ornithinibacillus halotolerans]|uniref:DUF421 domain-containing protein n=1 Tax=Ornithinibacillus halotolerans TaxID=1274357 RepID=A0A916S3K7_9BACI|nr:DUF421 domain-containing protein [Ornithinibacillus halotolerans]GGA81113.1 hypothetical protein GCM10008025_25580 [Ornithinibacillus halotolerans]